MDLILSENRHKRTGSTDERFKDCDSYEQESRTRILWEIRYTKALEVIATITQ